MGQGASFRVFRRAVNPTPLVGARDGSSAVTGIYSARLHKVLRTRSLQRAARHIVYRDLAASNAPPSRHQSFCYAVPLSHAARLRLRSSR